MPHDVRTGDLVRAPEPRPASTRPVPAGSRLRRRGRGRGRDESKGRNEPGASECCHGGAVLVSDLRVHVPPYRAEEHRHDAIAACIAGHHARTTVNNHGQNARPTV